MTVAELIRLLLEMEPTAQVMMPDGLPITSVVAADDNEVFLCDLPN